MTKQGKDKGFTIIEVALVLAVAALIFLVVFLAVPALQRNQRNDAIKRDISIVTTAVTSYSSNKNAMPKATSKVVFNGTTKTGSGTDGTALANYIDALSNNVTTVEVKDATANGSNVTTTGMGTASSSDRATITVWLNARCGTGPADVKLQTGTGRSAAVVGAVELSGTATEWYCQDAS